MAGIQAQDLVLFQWDEDLPENTNVDLLEDAVRILLKNELTLMKGTDWNILIPTPLDFLHHCFQFATFGYWKNLFYVNDIPKEKGGQYSLMHRRYRKSFFFKGCSILDKAVMDYQHHEFTSSILAAAIFWKVVKNEGKFEFKKI